LSNAENVTDRSVRPYGSESRGIDIVPASRSFDLAFNDRDVIGINCTDLIWGLGALHCMTQQQPA